MHIFSQARSTAGGVLFILDVLCVAAIWPIAVISGFPADGRPGALVLALYPLLHWLLLYAMGLYRRDIAADMGRALARLPVVVGMAVALPGTLAALLSGPKGGWGAGSGPESGHESGMLLVVLAFLGFTLAGLLARMIFRDLQRRRWLRRRLLVMGAERRAYDLLVMLRREGRSLDYDIAFLPCPGSAEGIDPRLARDTGCRVLPLGNGTVLAAAQRLAADMIVVAPAERRGMDLQPLLDCKKAGFPVVSYLSFIETEIRRVDLKRMELGWLIFSDGFTVGALDRLCKRVFDLVISALVLVLSAPLLLGGMLAIRMEGRGPIFYRQERVTLDGVVFQILKLRTMRPDAEARGAVWAAAGDSRITRAGAFLRRTRIDELPQLLNILRGEMSFVGPRPERPVFVEDLARQIPLYRERHMVKAGLTGWAQINYPYGASVNDARSKLSYDLYYVKNFSILFDFAILSQTLREVLWPSGVR